MFCLGTRLGVQNYWNLIKYKNILQMFNAFLQLIYQKICFACEDPLNA